MQIGPLVQRCCEMTENEPLSAALGKCRRSKHFYVVVYDKKGHYTGMADKRKCLRLKLDASRVKLKSVTTKVPVLQHDEPIEEAIRLLYSADKHALPVEKNGHIIGIISAGSVLAASKGRFKGYKARDICSDETITVAKEDPISKVISTCRTQGIGRIPVVDDKGSILGLCSLENIMYRFHIFPIRHDPSLQSKNRSSDSLGVAKKSKLPAKNVMTDIVWTVKPSDPVTKAVDLLLSNNINSVVVAERNKPVGMITAKDLLRVIK